MNKTRLADCIYRSIESPLNSHIHSII